MKFQKTDNAIKTKKLDVLDGLKGRCDYFERHIQDSELFRPEYETSANINFILEQNEILTKSHLTAIANLINELCKVEHYDGSGWLDYQIQLAHYLSLKGINSEIKTRKLCLL